MIFVQFTLFLTIGVMLWVYRDGKPIVGRSLTAFIPSFIWESLPVGIAGLGDGGDYRRRHGESFGGAEFAGVGHRGRFLPAADAVALLRRRII